MKIFFKDLLSAYLAFWAKLLLRERHPRIVGVTGSVGKTTTKEAIAAVLTTRSATEKIGFVGKTHGNLNTEIGLPLAIFQFEAVPSGFFSWLWTVISIPFRVLFWATIGHYPTVLVLEYAADRPGDIRYLTSLAQPEVAVVTAVGPAHLEKFKTVVRVAKEKGRLVRALPPQGLALLSKENSHTVAMASLTHARSVFVAGKGFALAKNIALEVARYFALPEAEARKALEQFSSLRGRLQLVTCGRYRVIDDTYNANPLSMELALDTLSDEKQSGQRTVAFLGHMAELGAESEEHHLAVGKMAHHKADLIIGVGKYAQLYDGVRWFPTAKEAALAVSEIIEPGDLVLVKGSRSVRMEQIVQAIAALGKE